MSAPRCGDADEPAPVRIEFAPLVLSCTLPVVYLPTSRPINEPPLWLTIAAAFAAYGGILAIAGGMLYALVSR